MTEGSGTYALLIELSAPATITFGALGERRLDAGWYAYAGSALGPGGFSRVDRHRRIADGRDDARHWHVDYLLGHPDASIDDVYLAPGADAECLAAGRIDGERIDGAGASDCGCASHLVFSPRRSPLVRSLDAAFD